MYSLFRSKQVVYQFWFFNCLSCTAALVSHVLFISLECVVINASLRYGMVNQMVHCASYGLSRSMPKWTYRRHNTDLTRAGQQYFVLKYICT